jgi:hypothetical protein
MEAIIGLLGAVGAIFLFIAAIATWVNTGKTADYLEKHWKLECEIRGRDPKTGKSYADAGKPLNG